MWFCSPYSFTGDNILCQNEHPEKGNSGKNQKMSVCAGVHSTYPACGLCPSHSTPVLSDPCPRQEHVQHSATTGKTCLWGHVPSVAGWCHQPPSPGTTGLDGHILSGQVGWRPGLHTSGLKIIATEDKEEPVCRREVSACAQLWPRQDLPSFLKQKTKAVSEGNVRCQCLHPENRYITWTGRNGFENILVLWDF